MAYNKPMRWFAFSLSLSVILFFSCSLNTFRPQLNLVVSVGESRDSQMVRPNPALSDLDCFFVAASSSALLFPSTINVANYSPSCLGLDQFVAEKAYTYSEIIKGASFAIAARDSADFTIFGVKTSGGSCASTAAATLALSPRPKLFSVGKKMGVSLISGTAVVIPATYDSNTSTNLLGGCLKLLAYSGNAGLTNGTVVLSGINGGIPPTSDLGGTMPLLLTDYVGITFLLSRAVSTGDHQRIDFVHPLAAQSDLDQWTSVKFFVPSVTGGNASPTVNPDCYKTEYVGGGNQVQLSFFQGGRIPKSWVVPGNIIEGGGISITFSPSSIRDVVTPTTSGVSFPFAVQVSVVSYDSSTAGSCSGLRFGAPIQLSFLP